MENSPPIRKEPPSYVWTCEIGRKIALNFGEDLFFFFYFYFLEITWFWAEKTFEFWISAEKSLWILAKTFFFFFFWRSPNFGRKKRLNFGFRPKNNSELWRRPFFFFFFFLGDHLILGGKNFEFPIFPRHFISNFGQIVWNWFKVNENSSQGCMHTSHSFKIAPPFSKSWLRAWLLWREYFLRRRWRSISGHFWHSALEYVVGIDRYVARIWCWNRHRYVEGCDLKTWSHWTEWERKIATQLSQRTTQHESLIDFCLVLSDLFSGVLDVRVKRSAELSTDHHLVVGFLRLSKPWANRRSNRSSVTYRIKWEALEDKQVRKQFASSISSSEFWQLLNVFEDIEKEWLLFRSELISSAAKSCEQKRL